MKTYAHVAGLTRTVHDALVSWARDLLKQADLETVEVYGQFPPEGTTSSHLVLFPYWVGPTPKLVEQGRSISLFNTQTWGDGQVSFIPVGWRKLGTEVGRLTRDWFPHAQPMVGASSRREFPMPLLTKLPKPMQKWYTKRQKEDPDAAWIAEWEGKKHVPPPALGWSPGIHLVIRYIAVASDPGRGTSQYSSTGAPLALPALSVIATGVHLERRVMMTVEPPPIPKHLVSYVEAIIDSTKGDEKKRITSLLEMLEAPEEIGIAIAPLDDLTNQEFALLMQALQRPLQAALNFQMRIVLGARPTFEPGSVTRARPPKPMDGFHVDDGSG